MTDDRFLKDGFYQPKNKDEKKEIRSMGNDLTFEKLYKHCAEADICLNCPLPTCEKQMCKRFEEEKRRLKKK